MPTSDAINLKEKVRRLGHQPGVYMMKDRFGRILYVGKAKDLKKRVSSYFQPSRKQAAGMQPKIAAMIELVRDFEIIEVRSETEALLLEGRLIKEWKPKYNTDFTDNKQFLLVRVDIYQPLPRFRLARNRTDERARYFGPFAHSGLLRRTLAEMRLRFGILLGDSQPTALDAGRWRLYDDARAEIYRQTAEVTEAEYRQRVESACAFLEGKSREWLEDLRAEMTRAAEALEYEKAARLRDITRALEETITPTRRFTRIRSAGEGSGDSPGVAGLRAHLQLSRAPRVIECFDISHISGTFVVASMARFKDGRPDRAGHRRYRIKSFVGNDDFRAMEEVVVRRYRRLVKEGRAFPDLVVIDGGRGQVNAALKAFLAEGLEAPPLIGLAKREETIIFSDSRQDLKLPPHDPALRLLQRARDEAHRLANSYNADLRSRRIRESVLDEFPGLGPVRRKALAERFPSLRHLRRASLREIMEVAGFGPKLASQLQQFLQSNQTEPDTPPDGFGS